MIVGLPRSGTTWTMRALASSPGARRVLEPDNEDKMPAAIGAKRGLGRYPVLAPGDRAPAYHRLWAWVLDGAETPARMHLAFTLLGPGAKARIHDGRPDPMARLAGIVGRSPRPGGGPGCRVVAKSIHAQLSVEWLADAFDVDVVLLLRHPANVLASWMEVNLKDARNSTLESRADVRARYLDRWGVDPPGPDPIERMCWRIGLLVAALEEAAANHPGWHLRVHEQLCTDPTVEFKALYGDLGLPWGDQAATFLHDHNTPGTGFTIERVASEMSGSWRHRLDPHQVATLKAVLARFPITTWGEDDFSI